MVDDESVCAVSGERILEKPLAAALGLRGVPGRSGVVRAPGRNGPRVYAATQAMQATTKAQRMKQDSSELGTRKFLKPVGIGSKRDIVRSLTSGASR